MIFTFMIAASFSERSETVRVLFFSPWRLGSIGATFDRIIAVF